MKREAPGPRAAARGRFAPGHLGELTQVIPFEMVDEVLAWAAFNALPGEPAARLGLAAACCELVGNMDGAIRRYERVWRVDHAFISAAFGLARMRLAVGDRPGAAAVLDEVPTTSSQQVAAQIAAARGRLDHRTDPLSESDFIEAATRLERLRLDTQRQASLAIEMF